MNEKNQILDLFLNERIQLILSVHRSGIDLVCG